MNYNRIWKAKAGEYYDIEHYDKIIKDSSYGYKENGEILFCLVKNNIPKEEREDFKNVIRMVCRAKTKNRGSSAGPCDLRHFPEKAVALCNKDGVEYTDGRPRFSVYFKDKDGKVVKRCQSNQARSGVAGYFDEVAGMPCRKVGWSANNKKKHIKLIELAKHIEKGHKQYCLDSYEYHKKRASGCPQDLLFKDTIYSTMTLNYDFRTATHKDSGDLKEGLSTLTIMEDELNNYSGFYLGLPEYKICFDLRDGDTIYFDAHEFHSNTEFKVLSDKLKVDDLTNNNFAGRMSIVCYLRERLDSCKKERVVYSRELSEIVSECYNTDDLSSLQFEDCKEIKEFGVDDRDCEYIKKFHNYFDNNKELRTAYNNLIKEIVSKHYRCDVLYQKTPNIRLHQTDSTSIGRRPEDPDDMIGYHSDNEFNHPKGEDNWIYALTDMYESNSLYYGDKSKPKNVSLEKDIYKMFNFNEIKHWNKINKTGKSRLSFDFRIMRKGIEPLKEDYYESFNYKS